MTGKDLEIICQIVLWYENSFRIDWHYISKTWKTRKQTSGLFIKGITNLQNETKHDKLELRDKSQNLKRIPLSHTVKLYPLKYFEPGLLSFMHILETYTATV